MKLSLTTPKDLLQTNTPYLETNTQLNSFSNQPQNFRHHHLSRWNSELIKLLLIFVFSAVALISGSSLAQPSPRYNAEPSTVGPAQAEGRILMFQVVPNDKTAKLFVLGKKQVQWNFNNTKILSITAFDKEKSEILQFRQDGSSYTITNWPSWKKDFELNISAEYEKQKEDVKVQIKGQP